MLKLVGEIRTESPELTELDKLLDEIGAAAAEVLGKTDIIEKVVLSAWSEEWDKLIAEHDHKVMFSSRAATLVTERTARELGTTIEVVETYTMPWNWLENNTVSIV